jgi:hypothetical protein
MSVRHCEACDRTMSVADQELARSRRADGLFCGACRDGATIAELRDQLAVAVERLEQIAAFEVDPDDGWDYSVGVMRAMAADALDRLGKAEAR